MAAPNTLGGKAWLPSSSDSLVKRKKKRIVKHKKKAWRITSDVADVERFLEGERLEERLGAPFSERPSESLFIVDTSAETKPAVKQTKRRKLKEIGPLKCYEILKPSSAVPDPLVKRNRVRLPEERSDPLFKRILAERRAQGKIPTRYVQSMKHHQENLERLAKKEKVEKLRSKFDFDLWGEKGEEVVIGDANVVRSELSEDLKKYTLERTGKRVYSRPHTLREKTSGLPPIEFPHPGTSYNPTYEDHQDLLRKAHEVEVKELEQEARTRRQLGPMLTKIPEAEQQANWMTEMSQGLADDQEEEEASASAPISSGVTDSETGVSPAPVEDVAAPSICVKPTKPKTRRQKIKAKLLKFREIRRLRLKLKKTRLAEVSRLRSIRREIRREEELQVERKEKRLKEKELRQFRPKTLGRYKYEEPPIEVNLSQEIAGSLRSLKVEGDVLLDRYKSLQRRNVIEPRIKQRVTLKYIPKKYTKRGHKEETCISYVNRDRKMNAAINNTQVDIRI